MYRVYLRVYREVYTWDTPGSTYREVYTLGYTWDNPAIHHPVYTLG